ncbi:MAG: MscS family membrane protein [Bacteriovoracaceae bacterium]|jgi:MscS family membrane protein
MKFSVLLLTLFCTFQLQANTSTPRESFRTFLKSMVKIKEGTGNEKDNYLKAISTLELSSKNQDIQYDLGKKYSDLLIRTLDKIKKVSYDEIPETLSSPIWYFDKRIFKDILLEIYLIQINGKWLFSKSSLNSLESYQKALKQSKNIDGVISLNVFSDKVREYLGPVWSEKIFIFENWQWLGLLIILMIAFLTEKISKSIITAILNHTNKVVTSQNTEKISEAIDPLAKIIFVFTTMQLISNLDLSTSLIGIIKRSLYIAMAFMTVWFAHKVIEYIADQATKRAQATETKFDDILIPLLTKTGFVLIYLLGALLIAKSLTIDVSGIVAGLGIGGLAFAFAAKDTLANFFGSIMLVLDRPFDIGDVITAGDIEGVVDEVGFRSTRIRTFNDSLITISNGELMNRPIDNKGKRRFRRLVTDLGLEYDTPAEKIEGFCEGIRQLIVSYKWTRKDNFHVYFSNFSSSSLDIKMVVYWETADYSRELSEKHRLLIDILRLAKEIGVDFAFPTQTVHMFNETKLTRSEVADSMKEFHDAQSKAKSVISKPLSLKNPRSNSQDKEQFGDNDFGI